jgi:hypothetical protein
MTPLALKSLGDGGRKFLIHNSEIRGGRVVGWDGVL